MAHFLAYEGRYNKAMKLPLGHYERAEVEKLVKESIEREYFACRQVEDRWLKKFPKAYRRLSREQVLALIYHLCDAIKTRHVKMVYFRSNKCGFMTAACYDARDKSIHYYWDAPFSITTTVHETAHHVAITENMGWGHGEGFIEVEEMLFEITYNWIKSHG